MKKLLMFLALIITSFLVVDQVKATVIYPTIAEMFLYSIYYVFTGIAFPIILLPFIIGLFFHRRFIAIWNFIIMFVILFLMFILLVGRPELSLTAAVEVFMFGLVCTSFFTIVSFLSSTVGKRFQKIYNLQEISNRLNYLIRIGALCLIYLFLISPLVYVVYFPPFNNYGEDSQLYSMKIGELIAFVASIGILYWMYKRAKSFSKKDIVFEKKDYM